MTLSIDDLEDYKIFDFVLDKNKHIRVKMAMLRVYDDSRDKMDMKYHFVNYLKKVIKNTKLNFLYV